MIVATVIAKLEADVDNMVRNSKRGADSMEKIGASAEKTGKRVDDSMKTVDKATAAVDKSAKRAGGAVEKTMKSMGDSATREGKKVSQAADAGAKAAGRQVDALKKAEMAGKKVGDATAAGFDKSTAAINRSRDAAGKFVSGGSGGPGGGIPGYTNTLKGVEKQADRNTMSLGKMASTGMKIGAAIGITTFFTQAVGGAAGAVIGYNQDLESAMIGMTTMLGSQKDATEFMGKIQDFAARTPFSFKGLVSATQSMMALGFSSKDVLPNLTAVGDATAALGGSMEDMGARVIRALGQMQAKGKVSAEEMMQLAEAGIPAWQYLADAIGVDVPTAMETAKKTGVQSAIAIDAIMKGMETDFGGMMAAQSKTMMGSWSTVLDYLQMNVAKAMKPVFDTMKTGVLAMADFLSSPAATDFARGFTKKVGDAFGTIKSLITPPIMDAVDLAKDLLEAGKDVGKELKPMFTVLGAVVIGAFKGLDVVIKTLDSMVTFIDKNEWAAKALATAIMLVVANMAAGKVVGFFSAFTSGAAGAMTKLKDFVSVSGKAKTELAGMRTALAEAKLASDSMSGAGVAKIRTLETGIANATKTSVGFKNGVKNVGSNLMGAFGGPAGLAVTGGIALIAWNLQKAAEKAAKFDAKVKEMESRMKDALKGAPGKVGEKQFTNELRTNVIVDYLYDSGKEDKLAHQLSKLKIGASDLVTWFAKSGSQLTSFDKAMDTASITGQWLSKNNKEVSETMVFLAKNAGDVDKTFDNLSRSGKGNGIFLREFDKNLTAAGTSAKAFIKTDLGKTFTKIARSGLKDKDFNKLVDGLSDTYKAYMKGTISAKEYDKALGDAADSAARAAAKNKAAAADQKSFADIFSAMTKVTDKELNENISNFDDYVTQITSTWNNITLEGLADQMGLDDWEKQMDGKLKYIQDWTKNLTTAINNGMSPAAIDAAMAGGPEQFGKIMDELAKSPDRIQGFNKRFADATSIDDAVANFSHSMDLMAVLMDPSSNIMTTMEWAASQGVDIMDVLAHAPDNVKAQWQKQLDEAGIKMAAFLSDVESKAPVDLGKKIKMPDKEFAMTLVSKLDSIMATMPSMGVAIDADPAKAKESFNAFVTEVINKKPGVDVKMMVDGKEVTADPTQVTAINKLLNFIDEAAPELDIKGDPAKAGEKLDWILSTIDQSAGTLGILADPTKGMTELKAFAYEVDRKTGIVTIDGNPIPADSKLAKQVKAMNEATGTINLDANEQAALAAIGNVKAAIGGIPFVGSMMAAALGNLGKSASPGMKNAERQNGAGNYLANAQGSITDYFANGGFSKAESHIAQIAPAGAMRVWAEPETGGEAYIPLTAGKRGRSLDILDQVAKRFGRAVVEPGKYKSFYANGAVVDTKALAMPVVNRANSVIEKIKGMMAAGGSPSDATGINPQFMGQYNAYNSALGGILRITSGWRSYATQVRLFAEKGGYSSSNAGAARPGTSKHEKGLAIDHAPHSTASMRNLAATFGLRYPMGNEPWHVQPVWAANGGILGGDKSAGSSMIRQATYDQGGILYPGYTMAYNGTGSPEYVSKSGDEGSVSTTWNINGDLDNRIMAQIKAQQKRRDRALARKMRKK